MRFNSNSIITTILYVLKTDLAGFRLNYILIIISFADGQDALDYMIFYIGMMILKDTVNSLYYSA
jgi:hypothetical protein